MEMFVTILLSAVFGFVVGGVFVLSQVKEEARGGLITFGGEAWRTTKVE